MSEARIGFQFILRSWREVASTSALIISAVGLIIVGFFLDGRMAALAAWSAGATLCGVALSRGGRRFWEWGQTARVWAQFNKITALNPFPCVLTDQGLAVLTSNRPGKTLLAGSQKLDHFLQGKQADLPGFLDQMQLRLSKHGFATDVILTGDRLIPFSVQRLGATWLWQFAQTEETRQNHGDTVPMCVVDEGDAILVMNDAACRLAGARTDNLNTLFPEEMIEKGSVHLLRSKSGPVPCAVHVDLLPNGWRELRFIAVEKASFSGDPIQEIPAAILNLSLDGYIHRSNRLARELLGITTHEAKHLSDLVEGLGRPMNEWLSQHMQPHVNPKPEFLKVRDVEHDRFVQISLRPHVVEHGSQLMAFLTDATEFKTLEAQFVQSQKMQAIGELAGGVAHDFNNLLTAISGHCDLLLLRFANEDPEYGDLIQIHQNANRAAALVGQLLAFSRRQTMRPQVIDVRDVMSELGYLLNRLVGEKVKLVFQYDDDLPPIRVDSRQLEQVLMNLVVNARDAMADGGEIVITSTRVAFKNEQTRDSVTLAAGKYLQIEVADTGQGIAKDLQSKIFDPFFSTKQIGEGTGLGLSTVYGIIKQSGGFIFVKSAPGQGTCFTLLFPIVEGGKPIDVPKAPTQPTFPSSVSQDAVVLLVEDEAPVRAFAARALQLVGIKVIEASDGLEALEIIQDQTLRVDVCVSDVVMPGMNGPTWVKEALNHRADIRVVYISGYAEHAIDSSLFETGVEFLSKPFSLDQLTAVVRRQLQ